MKIQSKMAEYKLILPSMGEGVMEATIISWLYNEGDTVNEDDSVVEIATDKVDSDVPTPVSGKIVKILKHKDEVAKIGEAIAILDISTPLNGTAGEGEAAPVAEFPKAEEPKTEVPAAEVVKELEKPLATTSIPQEFSGDVYLSPLVKSIAQEENISEAELKTIKGSGLEGRITKEDILAFVKNRNTSTPVAAPVQVTAPTVTTTQSAPVQVVEGDEIIQCKSI